MPGQSSASRPGSDALAALRAQQRADKDLQELLKTESPAAGVKAFGAGLAAGAAIPFALNMSSWALSMPRELQAIEQRAHLAHLLESQGMAPKGKGAPLAAAVHHALASPGHISSHVEEVTNRLRASAGEGEKVVRYRLGDGPTFSEDAMRRGAAARGLSLEELVARKAAIEVPEVDPFKASRNRTFASPEAAGSILEKAKKSFNKALEAKKVKLPPLSGTIARSFGSAARRSVAPALLLGAPAGIFSYTAHRRRERELKELRKSAAEETATDRALKAAPGVAAVPGFALGAASPQLFNPRALFPAIKKKHLGGKRARALSGVLGAGTFATTAWLPSAFRDAYKAAVPADQARPTESPLIITKQASARLDDVLWSMCVELEKIGGSPAGAILGSGQYVASTNSVSSKGAK